MRLILNFGIFSSAFHLTPRWSWSTEGTGSKTRWHSTYPLVQSPRRRSQWGPRRTASSSAKSARRVSACSASSTDTWSATVTWNAIFVPSVERASTTPSTWKDTQELIQVQIDYFVLCGLILHFSFHSSSTCSGVRPYKCNLCEKSFTQRCSLESHCLKVHGVAHQYDYKQRRSKVRENMQRAIEETFCKSLLAQMYVCEDCGHTTAEPEIHYLHLKDNHPYSPALLKFYDKRHFKFNNSNFASMLLQCST